MLDKFSLTVSTEIFGKFDALPKSGAENVAKECEKGYSFLNNGGVWAKTEAAKARKWNKVFVCSAQKICYNGSVRRKKRLEKLAHNLLI
jgi:hypothetical protein